MGFHSFCFCNFKWVKLKAKCFWEPHCSVSSGQENLQCTLLVLSLKNSFSFLSKSLPFSKHFMYSPRWLLAFLRLAMVSFPRISHFWKMPLYKLKRHRVKGCFWSEKTFALRFKLLIFWIWWWGTESVQPFPRSRLKKPWRWVLF